MKKIRLLSLLLIAALLLGTVPAASAAETEGDWAYTAYKGEATVTDYLGSATVVTVPDTLGGCPVTDLAPMLFNRRNHVTEVTLPGTLKRIPYNAFLFCRKLRAVTISEGISRIESSAFQCCAALTAVAIPDSLTSIGENAFRGCALTDIRIPDSVTTIGSYAFSGCASLRSATLPAGLTAIPDDLFYGCAALTEVRIPGTVTSIGINAFGGTGLTDVTIPNGVTELTSCEFKDCVRLARVRLPDSLTVLRGGAFSGCKALEEITIPSGLTEVGGGAFSDCTGLTTLRVRAGVQAIGASAFSNCSSLKTMYIPDSVTKIGKDAFTDCDALTDVYYSGSAAQWAAIDIDRTVYERRVDSGGPQLAPHLRTYAPFVSNTQLLRAAVHYNSDISYAVSDPVRVTVRGIAVQWTDAEPFIDANRRTMVPLRAVAEALGLSVSWVSEGRYARFTDGSRAISFPIGKTVAYSSEGDIPIDTAAVILSGRTYAPIRYLAEYFGYTVGWYGTTRTVTIG